MKRNVSEFCLGITGIGLAGLSFINLVKIIIEQQVDINVLIILLVSMAGAFAALSAILLWESTQVPEDIQIGDERLKTLSPEDKDMICDISQDHNCEHCPFKVARYCLKKVDLNQIVNLDDIDIDDEEE